MQKHVTIIGAGPAGLTAAYLLRKANIPVTVFETDPTYVGGLARTMVYKDYCFDIGGHRFFSKSQEIEDLWTEMLPNDMLERPRLSRIYYRGKFFTYPLKISEVLFKFNPLESLYCALSYLYAKIFPIVRPATFEDWVSNHFGYRLFSIFFKTYTEKVWGMSCKVISADWAAQRIQGLSLFSTLLKACLPKIKSRKRKKIVKSLIDTFRYPRKGPGMLWEACADKIRNMDGTIIMGTQVESAAYHALDKQWQVQYRNQQNELQTILSTHVLSSAPLQTLANSYLQPALSKTTQEAARRLQYRDFLIVILILKDKNKLRDNWIYIHDPSVDVARIQNFKSWSPEMIPDPTMCCYGMEYFCFKNDALWSSADDILILKATQELAKIGLIKIDEVLDGCVIRQPKAYPVYNDDYKENVLRIREELEEKYPNLQLIGRNGMHKYNNQDHAMMTASLAVKNILADETRFNVWQVNQDAEYIESTC
ncbi:MAG: FAD-dependent oxidoreductase [Gammaproteobacteria bacterium RIFCSPHIGHO2_12_FULL_42_10]|nr:MAG: FAD-dependent oxidoreductase [Gammaproteobacteria bacterium RIFCSPHIGHO2_12_FULL_42_10]